MKKPILVFAIFISLIEFIYSKPRTANEAFQIAKNQVNQSIGSIQKIPSGADLTLVYTATDASLPPTNGLFYIYNKGVDSGFIIVSGDDRANTILGYSDSGSFDVTQIPDGLKYWIEGFAAEIKSIINDSIVVLLPANSTASNAARKVTAVSVSPLLGGIQWNQGSPYNNLCPLIPNTTTRCVTGCVATAMATAMDYYKWPISGTGSNTYTSTTNKISLTVDFSKTQYDWASMTNTYNSSSTLAQNNAVASLMYHCGVAVNMNYGLSSSAYSSNMAKALINNFGYDSNLQLLTRDFYTLAEWSSILKSELNASRPILYSGQAADGGHQFVCDGYDSNSYFHFNWGWGGSSNGYFQLTALNPLNQGIGGSSGGFNRDQSIVTGFQKPNPNSVPSYVICSATPMTSSVMSFLRQESITVTANNTYNWGINSFTGDLGLALYDNSGVLVQVIKTTAVSALPSYSGWVTYPMTNVTIPGTIINGNYKLYWVYKATTETNWQIMRVKVGTPNYLNVQVTTSNVNLTIPSNTLSNLALNTVSVTGNLYQNKLGRFTVNVTNSGGGEYYSKIGIQLTSSTDASVSQVFTEDVDYIPGENKNYYFSDTIKLAPGNYTVSVLYDALNNWTDTSVLTVLGYGQAVNVGTAPTGLPNLTLNSRISFLDATAVKKDNAVLTANITNSSGYYDKKLIAFIFPAAGGSSLTYLGYQTAIFDVNEQKLISFAGSLNLPATGYMVAVYSQDASNSWTQLTPLSSSVLGFTLIDNISAINAPMTLQGFDIYPNPATNFIRFNSDAIVRTIQIYDYSGKLIQSNQPKTSGIITLPVEKIQAGNYIVQMNTDQGIKIGKFTKY
jgi:hypothetical protein